MAGNDSNTKLLLHFDGTNGSTTFTDTNAGSSAHTVTAQGNAQLTTTSPKFDSASLLLDGTGDFADVTYASDLLIGTGDFSIDFWCWLNASQTDNDIVSNRTSISDIYFHIRLITTNTIQAGSGGGAATMNAGSALTTGVWNHIYWGRQGTTYYLGINGTVTTSTSAGSNNYSGTTNWRVGSGDALSGDFNGKVDEVRFSNVARWTANFTPPITAYGLETSRSVTATSAQGTGISNSRGKSAQAQTSSQTIVTRLIGKIAAIVISSSIRRLVGVMHLTAITSAIFASVTKRTAKNIASVIGQTARVALIIGKRINVTASSAILLARIIAKQISVISANTLLVRRAIGHSNAIAMASVALVTRRFGKSAAATLTNSSSTIRGIGKIARASHSQSAGVLSIRSLVTKIVSSLSIELTKLVKPAALKAWPSNIPNQALAGSYSEKVEQNAITFATEYGPPKIRSRSSAPTEMIGFDVLMSSAQYELLKTFFRSSLKNGTMAFTMVHPRTTATTTFIFLSAPKIAYLTVDQYRVTLSLRRKP